MTSVCMSTTPGSARMQSRWRAILSDAWLLWKPSSSAGPEPSWSSSLDRAPPVTILSLPNELLVQINASLDNVNDLLALCQATKSLNTAATPFLYHSFIGGEDPVKLYQLVGSLCADPQLANHLRQISLHIRRESIAIRPSTAQLINRLEAILPIASRDSWLHRKLAAAVRTGSYDANAIILLFLAKNVERLEIVVSDPEPEHLEARQFSSFDSFDALIPTFIGWASLPPTGLDRSSTEQPALAKIEKLSVHPNSNFRVFSAPHAATVMTTDALQFPSHFLLLPRLRAVATSFSAPWPHRLPDIGPARSAVTRLHLTDCCMGSSDLAVLVRACHALAECGVEWHDSMLSGRRRSDVSVDFSELRAALMQHSQSLKHLKLIVKSLVVLQARLSAPLHSMASFPALCSLELDDCPLLGSPVGPAPHEWEADSFQQLSHFLPPNLEHFSLHTRKRSSAAPEVLAHIHHMLPNALQWLDLSFFEKSLSHVAARLPELASALPSSLTVVYSPTATLHRSWRKLCGGEVQLALGHPDGVHAALREVREYDSVQKVVDEGEGGGRQ